MVDQPLSESPELDWVAEAMARKVAQPAATAPKPAPPRWHKGYVRGTYHRSLARRVRIRFAQINRLADLGVEPKAIERAVVADSPGEEGVAALEVYKVLAARGIICERLEEVAAKHVADALGEVPYAEGESEHRGKQRLSILTGVRVLQPGGAQVAVTQTINNDNRQAAIYALSTPQGRQAMETLARVLEGESGGACGENEPGIMEAGGASEPDFREADRGSG